jgi:glycosyltransferase involved in cell wall biosynthesis
MKLLVHDYSGHNFQAQLSRSIARRGINVVHAYFTDIGSPRADLIRRHDDPALLRFEPLSLDSPFEKYNPLRRVQQEREYGRRLAQLVDRERPDWLILSNTPNDILDVLRRRLPAEQKILWWVQDVYSVAIRTLLRKRLGVFALFAGWFYRRMEQRFARRANAIVLITEDFRPEIAAHGVEEKRMAVIENWSPLDELLPVERENAWRREHGLSGKTLVLYSGTLGLKHDPNLLVDTAESLAWRTDVQFVVVSEGLGAEFLERERVARKLKNLKLLPWQPYDRLSEVLSAGDILLALIEKESGVFSVPSKVLSYFCVGHPVLAAVPDTNLAARTIERAKAGYVVEPGDRGAFLEKLSTLLDEPQTRAELGGNARAYAEKTFDIDGITDRFLAMCRA